MPLSDNHTETHFIKKGCRKCILFIAIPNSPLSWQLITNTLLKTMQQQVFTIQRLFKNAESTLAAVLLNCSTYKMISA